MWREPHVVTNIEHSHRPHQRACFLFISSCTNGGVIHVVLKLASLLRSLVNIGETL